MLGRHVRATPSKLACVRCRDTWRVTVTADNPPAPEKHRRDSDKAHAHRWPSWLFFFEYIRVAVGRMWFLWINSVRCSYFSEKRLRYAGGRRWWDAVVHMSVTSASQREPRLFFQDVCPDRRLGAPGSVDASPARWDANVRQEFEHGVWYVFQ